MRERATYSAWNGFTQPTEKRLRPRDCTIRIETTMMKRKKKHKNNKKKPNNKKKQPKRKNAKHHTQNKKDTISNKAKSIQRTMSVRSPTCKSGLQVAQTAAGSYSLHLGERCPGWQRRRTECCTLSRMSNWGATTELGSHRFSSARIPCWH